MNNEMFKQMLFAVIRYLIAIVGGFLVANGLIDAETVDAWVSETAALIVGLLLIAIPVVLRYYNVKFNVYAVREAVKAEPPPTNRPGDINLAVQDVKEKVKSRSRVLPY